MDTEWERHINAWLHRMEEAENAFDPEEGEADFAPLPPLRENLPEMPRSAAHIHFIVEEQDD